MNITLKSILLLALAQPAIAQNFTGSEFGFEYNQFTADGNDDGLNLFARTEIALTDDFALGISLAQLEFEADLSSATFHGVYHGYEAATLGAFVSASDEDVNAFGVEASAFVLGGVFEGYLGKRVADSDDSIVLGANTVGALGNSNFSFFTDFDVVANDDLSVLTNEFGVAYSFGNGPDVFVQLGRVTETDGSDTSNFDYIGIGAEIQLDVTRGVTFGTR